MASTSGITTTEGKESLRQGFFNVLHLRRPAQAVYTCPPFSFFIGSGINTDSTANFIIVDTLCVPQNVGGNENAAVVQINHTSVEKAASHLAKWMEMRLESSRVGNVQNCKDILLDPSNSERDPELTDTYLCLENEEENESLCNALEDSLREMETSVTNTENDSRHNQTIKKDTKDEEHEEENESLCNVLEDSLRKMETRVTNMENDCDNPKKIEEETKDSSEQGELWSCPSEMAALAKTTETLSTGYLARFGHSSLKQFQKHAIQAVELCRDSIIIQPTASGKSVCFQLPSLFDDKLTTVVVCPTISLINSHVKNLKLHGIECSSLGPSSGGALLQSLSCCDKEQLPPLIL